MRTPLYETECITHFKAEITQRIISFFLNVNQIENRSLLTYFFKMYFYHQKDLYYVEGNRLIVLNNI